MSTVHVVGAELLPVALERAEDAPSSRPDRALRVS